MRGRADGRQEHREHTGCTGVDGRFPEQLPARSLCKRKGDVMASISRRKDGVWRARYRDQNGEEHARHFGRKVDAQRWLDEVTACQWPGVGPRWWPSRSPRFFVLVSQFLMVVPPFVLACRMR